MFGFDDLDDPNPEGHKDYPDGAVILVSLVLLLLILAFGKSD